MAHKHWGWKYVPSVVEHKEPTSRIRKIVALFCYQFHFKCTVQEWVNTLLNFPGVAIIGNQMDELEGIVANLEPFNIHRIVLLLVSNMQCGSWNVILPKHSFINFFIII